MYYTIGLILVVFRLVCQITIVVYVDVGAIVSRIIIIYYYDCQYTRRTINWYGLFVE